MPISSAPLDRNIKFVFIVSLAVIILTLKTTTQLGAGIHMVRSNMTLGASAPCAPPWLCSLSWCTLHNLHGYHEVSIECEHVIVNVL